MHKPGDKLEVKLDSEVLHGSFVPSPEGRDDILILKLSSGYNRVIKKSRIFHITLIEKSRTSKKKMREAPQNTTLPKVTLLHTGGTIAARVDYRLGAVVAGFITAEELLAIYPDLHSLANISCRMVCNIGSEDMRFGHYNLILEAIKEEIAKGAEAIIIPHGTDTMHYTAAALAFGLENLSTPIILVGSQRSSDRGSSDAYSNLMSAMRFATTSDFGGVAICMHASPSDDLCALLPPFSTRKMHTSRRDAFRAINSKPYATIDWASGETKWVRHDYPKKSRQSIVLVKGFDTGLKIAFVKAHPNMMAAEVAAYRSFDGVVIEGTGLGHIPNVKSDAHTSENARVLSAVGKLVKSGVLVAMAPQTIYGRLQMNVYTPARQLRALGVTGHLSSMTPETTFIKMAFLLSNHTKAEAHKLIDKNIRGEITPRLEAEEFFA